MTRQQLEHIIRAAGSVTDENTILILGSQAILGTVGSPSEVLARSIEADVYPLRAPEKMEVRRRRTGYRSTTPARPGGGGAAARNTR